MTKAKRKHKADEENKQSSEEKKAPISKGGKKGAKTKRRTSSTREKNNNIKDDDNDENENDDDKEKKAPISKGGKKGAKKKWSTSSTREKKNKNKKNDDNDDDDNDEDNNIDPLKKKRKESNQDSIDDYLKNDSDLKPSSKLLNKFEEDARVAQLMFADNSGYDYSNSSIILNELRSDDDEIREAAIDKYLELIKTATPNLSEQVSIRDNYYARGGHHELVLQACGVCGRNDFKNILNGDLFEIDSSFTKSVLRLTSDELIDYKHSRVEGYLNVTAMLYYANHKKVSFQQAYIDLYENENSTDAYFELLSKKAFIELKSQNQYTTPIHVSDDSKDEPYILYIVPDLVKFSSNEKACKTSVGSVCICINNNML
jgi:hypothetical protein